MTKSQIYKTFKQINLSILCVNWLFCHLFGLKPKISTNFCTVQPVNRFKIEFQTQICVLIKRFKDILVIRCKNCEFYLLEPLKSPALIRSFFIFVRPNFKQFEVSRKTQPTKLLASPNAVPRETNGRSVSGPQ